MNFAAAENPRQRGAEGRRDLARSTSRLQKVRKVKGKLKRVGPAGMEEVSERLEEAFEKVAANRGAPGPDRQSIEYVREHIHELVPVLRASMLDGSYRPGDIRRGYRKREADREGWAFQTWLIAWYRRVSCPPNFF